MTANATYNLVVLFDDEVRLAARLLRAFFETGQDLSADEAVQIIEACHCALQGADADDAVLMLGRKPSIAAPVAPPEAPETDKQNPTPP